ncbi:hypothetical protein CHS0354_024763 [Potamilus streckersoni]|uniref:C2H2-type domain-containing protein n=1 Tax=Potamilus streckersoni TaxID=2493646 RepID=A0AAE0VLL3_9BIVA|nr:hypothetical protein CHS0354_024763 [Potamilus streckersoni]
MFSKAVAKCWVCPAEFARRWELKNHLAAAPHSRLRVVCVWCTDEEEVFRRMVDLKQHVMQLHPKVVDDVHTDFFGKGNGFWMALHPKDYNQIVGATPMESSAAVQARVRLLIWVGKCPNTSRSRIEWQRGWEFIYSARARRSIEAPSLHVQDKYKLNTASTVSRKGSSEKAFVPDYGDEVDGMNVPPYSPSKPGIKRELTIHHIKIDLSKSVVDIFDKVNQVWYKVDLQCKDERDACSLVRKMMAIAPGDCLPFLEGGGSQETSEDIKHKIIALLGVSKGSLETISRFLPPTFGVGCKRKVSSTASAVVSTSPSPSATPAIVGPSIPVTSALQSPEQRSCTPLQDENVLDLSVKRDKQVIPSNLYMASPPPVSASKTRAANLLECGCMPLFPPARREWQEDTAIHIPIGSSVLTWPPKGWKRMNSDQKLLQWEYASMLLENSIEKPLLLSLNRGVLLDKFNMLALPGTSVPMTTEQDLIYRKASYYNYEILRSTAIGNSFMEDSTVERILKLYEASADRRETSTDFLINLIKKAGVSQRLEN